MDQVMFHREGSFFLRVLKRLAKLFWGWQGNYGTPARCLMFNMMKRGKCKCEDCNRLYFPKIDTAISLIIRVLQPCELACLHQEVESNSSPLRSGHFLGIYFYHRTQKWHWSLIWSLKWTLVFQMIPLGILPYRTELPMPHGKPTM